VEQASGLHWSHQSKNELQPRRPHHNSVRMPDAGCRMPDAGCRMPDADE
jgi:hypothetical protein